MAMKKILPVVMAVVMVFAMMPLTGGTASASDAANITVRTTLLQYDGSAYNWVDGVTAGAVKSIKIDGEECTSKNVGPDDKVTLRVEYEDKYMTEASSMKVNNVYIWNKFSDYTCSVDNIGCVYEITFRMDEVTTYDFVLAVKEGVKVTYDVNGGTKSADWPGDVIKKSKGEVTSSIELPLDKVTAPEGKELDYIQMIEGSKTYDLALADLNTLAMSYDYDVTFKWIWKTAGGTDAEDPVPKDTKVTKSANTMSVKGKTVKVKYKKLKKKAQTIKAGKAVKVSKAQGAVTYKLVSAKKGSKKIKLKTAKKQFRIASATGNIKVKKKLKKGTYKLQVKVTAKGNANYNAKSQTVTVKVKIK